MTRAWSSSLTEFLNHSNEDQRYVELIGKIIMRWFKDSKKYNFRIADLGCGPASKAAALSSWFQKQSVSAHFELVDLDPAWQRQIQRNILRAVDKTPACCLPTFQTYCPLSVKEWLPETDDSHIDIAQFIQVPYDDESESMVFDASCRLLTSGAELVVISTEDRCSDLHQLRRVLRMMGIADVPEQRVSNLVGRFAEAGVPFRLIPLRNKFLYVNKQTALEARWFKDLIFGDKATNIDPDCLKSAFAYAEDRRLLRNIDSGFMSIPDVVLVLGNTL